MTKREGLIVARFKEGVSVLEIAAELNRTVLFVEEALRAYLLAEEPKEKKK